MRKAAFYISLLITGLFTASCNRTDSIEEQKAVAKVGDKKLYESELAALFASTPAPEDSASLAESYIDMWIKKQLKVREAENLFSGNTGEIDRMVEEYRNSLLTHRLEQYYVDTRLDSLYDASSIEQYYSDHRGEFLLDRPIVKGSVVRVPEGYRQKTELKKLMSGNAERYQDFLDTSLKNDFELHHFDSWTDLSHFVAMLPPLTEEEAHKLFSSRDVTQIEDGTDLWYVYITHRLEAGQPTPLERVTELISRVLFNQRKQEIIRNAEDSIYRSALRNGEIEITSHRDF
ncbi:MAG: hypothetical protein LIO77_00345 [Rikenellaceae bacterium]|nr:hypothetical protein [Rikenellaceae bacterium]